MNVLSRIGTMIVAGLCVLALPVHAQGNGGAAAGVTNPDNPYTPPACVPGVPFSDITCTTGFDPWIEQFGADGITAGCGGGKYCPSTPVTRDQMAVFVEKAMHGTAAWSPGDLGNYNTGIGSQALLNNGAYAQASTAIGNSALYTQSFTNAGTSYFADNTAVGFQALYFNQPDGGNTGSDGTRNTAVGTNTLLQNTTGYQNTAVGHQAGASWNGTFDTFIGAYADAFNPGFTDATAVGAGASVDASYHVRIGDTQVTQIGGQVAWSNLSDVRAKTNIQGLDVGLDFVMALRPVSYQLIKGNGRTDMGFVAQDVEMLLGDRFNVLGIGGDKDRTLSLRYTDLIAPMVKAMQEQQATIEKQQAQIESRDARIAALENQQEAQQAAIKVLAERVAALEQKKQ